jgi:hypothetical protein
VRRVQSVSVRHGCVAADRVAIDDPSDGPGQNRVVGVLSRFPDRAVSVTADFGSRSSRIFVRFDLRLCRGHRILRHARTQGHRQLAPPRTGSRSRTRPLHRACRRFAHTSQRSGTFATGTWRRAVGATRTDVNDT